MRENIKLKLKTIITVLTILLLIIVGLNKYGYFDLISAIETAEEIQVYKFDGDIREELIKNYFVYEKEVNNYSFEDEKILEIPFLKVMNFIDITRNQFSATTQLHSASSYIDEAMKDVNNKVKENYTVRVNNSIVSSLGLKVDESKEIAIFYNDKETESLRSRMNNSSKISINSAFVMAQTEDPKVAKISGTTITGMRKGGTKLCIIGITSMNIVSLVLIDVNVE